jgi:hypothetical protein
LENLLVNTCLKRRIRGRAIRDYRIGEHKNLPSIFNVAPTKCDEKVGLGSEDFLLK